MGAPPLLLERPLAAQIAIAVGGPLILGILCGLLAGWSETIYLVVSIAAIVGGIAAGYEHPTSDEGAVRGFCGGLVFGVAIVTTVALSNAKLKANLPDPHGGLVVVTTILGIIFGMIGGALRHRHDRRASAPRRPAGRA